MEYFLYGPGFEGSFGKYSLTVSKGYSCVFSTVITNRPHLHSFYELCFVSSGSGEYSHGDLQTEISAGDIIISDPGVTHEISSRRTRDLELVFFRLEIEEKSSLPGHTFEDRIIQRFLYAHNHVYKNSSHLLSYIPLLVSAREGQDREYGSRSAIRSMVLEGLELLCSDIDSQAGSLDPIVTRALEHIDRNITEKLPVGDLAVKLGISQRQLRRIFRKSLGERIIDVIIKRRMDYARQLLSMDWRVSEVSFALNYDDPAQFSRIFKKCFDVSPKCAFR